MYVDKIFQSLVPSLITSDYYDDSLAVKQLCVPLNIADHVDDYEVGSR